MESHEKDHVIGIDIGGQTIKLGVVDARGEVLAQKVIKTSDDPSPEVVVSEIAEAAGE